MITKFLNLFTTAMENGIKKPQLLLGNYKFRKAGSQQIIWITGTEKYPNTTYMGRIDMTNGDWYPAAHLHKDHVNAINNIMNDPGTAAKVYGQKTGTCCCCGRTLTNKTSIRLMIGPICMEKFGFIPSELIDETEDDGQIKLADI